MENGKFIVLEGADGAGTTTIANYVGDRLRQQVGEENVINTFEPTNYNIGKFIREILQRKKTVQSRLAMTHLFVADRAEHTTRLIIPALEKGKIVICDRYFHSTIVYQSVKNNLFDSVRKMEGVKKSLKGHILPDLVLFLDCGAEELKRRREKRNKVKELYENEEYQKMVVSLYRKVFEDYNFLPVERIDAEKSLTVVKTVAWNIIKNWGWKRIRVSK
jgi:dTMP kinase